MSMYDSFLFFVFVFGFLVFFWFVVAYCTQLLSQAMYNLMIATTMAETCSCQLPSTIQPHNNNIVVFDYFIHPLYTVINTQRGCHTLKFSTVVGARPMYCLSLCSMLYKMKVHRRKKYSITKYHYGITKYMTGVCDTPPD